MDRGPGTGDRGPGTGRRVLRGRRHSHPSPSPLSLRAPAGRDAIPSHRGPIAWHARRDRHAAPAARLAMTRFSNVGHALRACMQPRSGCPTSTRNNGRPDKVHPGIKTKGRGLSPPALRTDTTTAARRAAATSQRDTNEAAGRWPTVSMRVILRSATGATKDLVASAPRPHALPRHAILRPLQGLSNRLGSQG